VPGNRCRTGRQLIEIELPTRIKPDSSRSRRQFVPDLPDHSWPVDSTSWSAVAGQARSCRARLLDLACLRAEIITERSSRPSTCSRAGAQLSDRDSPARSVQGCRTPCSSARERCAAPPDRPDPLPAGRPAMARGTVPADPVGAENVIRVMRPAIFVDQTTDASLPSYVVLVEIDRLG